jgi:head-tail adaptor
MRGEFSGRLSERVLIEHRQGNRDLLAGASGAYAYAGEAWAMLMPMMPGDQVQGQALSANARWQVTMRKREGVDQRTRLTWRRKYLAVRSITHDPREPAQMVLICEEVR